MKEIAISGLHEAEQVMPQQIGPDDGISLPEDVFKTFQRVIQLLGWGEVNLLVFKLVMTIQKSVNRAEAKKVFRHSSCPVVT
jgi:hypothetical protein